MSFHPGRLCAYWSLCRYDRGSIHGRVIEAQRCTGIPHINTCRCLCGGAAIRHMWQKLVDPSNQTIPNQAANTIGGQLCHCEQIGIGGQLWPIGGQLHLLITDCCRMPLGEVMSVIWEAEIRTGAPLPASNWWENGAIIPRSRTACRASYIRSWIHVVHDCLSTCPATWSATTVHVEQCSWSNSFLENCVFVLILSVFIEKFIYVCIAGVEASLMLALKAGCML